MGEFNFMALLEREFKWPTIDDKLFCQTHGANDAIVAKEENERMHHMMEGYKFAASILVQQAEQEPYLRVKLIYPIIFCYRQSIELNIKKLLAWYGDFVEVKSNWDTHSLETLWQCLILLCQKYDNRILTEDGTKAVAERIVEFAKVDPGSFNFRYPLDKKGQLVNLDFDRVNLANLAETMGSIESFFESLDLHFQNFRDSYDG